MVKASQAANTNQPLWQRVTLAVAGDIALMAQLDDAARDALWNKAVDTMKPDAAELEALHKDAAARDAYMLSFVKAYRAGRPPYSDYTSRRLPAASD